MDGEWWTTLSYTEKVRAVQGIIEGFSAGYEEAATNLIFEKSVSIPVYKRVVAAEPSFANRNFTTSVDRLDQVYENHPRLLKTRVSLFVTCALVSGNNCDRLAKLLRKTLMRVRIVGS